MKEKLLHYAWKHRLFFNACLKTTSGESIEILDVGLYNTNDGPDFFNAKIKIDGTEWIGNVELHEKASQWNKHGHNTDSRYNNVVLHVCVEIDAEAITQNKRKIWQLKMQLPNGIEERYGELINNIYYPPCHTFIPNISALACSMWLQRLQIERLETKTNHILKIVEHTNGSWEDTFFIVLARNFGFGINADAFEKWASTLSLQSIAHHRDNLFQVEAFFLGHAGLLKNTEEITNDAYLAKLKAEYSYLLKKFKLPTEAYIAWSLLRLRPSNFPHLRLAQLAMLYHKRIASFSSILECKSLKQLKKNLVCHCRAIG